MKRSHLAALTICIAFCMVGFAKSAEPQVDVTTVLKRVVNEIYVNARNLSVDPAGMLTSIKLNFENGESWEIASDDTWGTSIQKAGTRGTTSTASTLVAYMRFSFASPSSNK